MKEAVIRNVVVGGGMPKVLVPIVGRTREEILAKGEEIKDLSFDVVEWRADFYEDVLDKIRLLKTLKDLNRVLGDKPVMFTIRTAKEGGNVDVSPETYADLCIAAAETGFADVIDVEIFTGDPVVERMIAGIHAAGKPVIASSHEFRSTPAKEEMIRRLRKMQDMGADILKIAVMPETKADVLTLLSATEEMARCHAERPLVTMSMSPAGVISRICGEAFGSAMTFGAVGETSAPGQIPVDRLNTVLKIMHDAG
jgi:3-dehydroquinate dehydratase-1